MHLPAPRSRSGHESSTYPWTKSFESNRAVGTRWRWVLMTGTLATSVFFQIGVTSNADSQEVDTTKSNEANKAETTVISNVAINEVKIEATPAAPIVADKVEPKTATPDADSTQPTALTVASPSGTPATNADKPVNNTPAVVPTVVPSRSVKLFVTVDGQLRAISVKAGQKLGAALAEGGLKLEKLDRVWPQVNSAISDGLKVRVQTVREKLETRTEKIAPGFRVELTNKLAPGREQLASYGKSGTVTVTDKVTYAGGKRVRKTEMARKVTTPAQDKTLALGSDNRFLPHRIPYHNRYARAYQAERQLSARGGSPRDRQAGLIAGSTTLRPIKCMTMTCTGYSANEGFIGGGSHTATGMLAVRGAIAVDPRVIPLGTKLYVEGYGYGFACDTGGAIKGNHIDLAFNSVSECYRQGRRKMKVWILADVN